MNPSLSVEGRVALVTGAASGMGRATATLFAEQGATVACLDINGEGVDAVANAIGKAARAWTVDAADGDAIARVTSEVVDALGPVDILVNNAGVSLPAAIDGDGAAFEESWNRTFAVNLVAYQRFVRACLPHLERDRAGRIVNIASTEGIGAQKYIAAYTASKHGVIGLTRSLAVELGPRGVTANAVCPGPIMTGMTAVIPDEAKQKFARRKVPLRRYGQPEEIAHAVYSLCLPGASYINGAVLVVDGGMTAKNDSG